MKDWINQCQWNENTRKNKHTSNELLVFFFQIKGRGWSKEGKRKEVEKFKMKVFLHLYIMKGLTWRRQNKKKVKRMWVKCKFSLFTLYAFRLFYLGKKVSWCSLHEDKKIVFLFLDNLCRGLQLLLRLSFLKWNFGWEEDEGNENLENTSSSSKKKGEKSPPIAVSKNDARVYAKQLLSKKTRA